MSTGRELIAFFAAPAVGIATLTLPLAPFMGSEVVQVFAFALPLGWGCGAALGLPILMLVRRFKLRRAWWFALFGAIAGGFSGATLLPLLLPIALVASEFTSYPVFATILWCTLSGLVSGLAFWWFAFSYGRRREMRREVPLH